MHRFYEKLELPISIEEAWAFFSDPRNLSKITPEAMRFEILNAPGKMYPGQIIQYHVRPLLGIKMNWVTEITHVEEGRYFVDEQRKGPYSIWHHEHRFKALDSHRVLMEDELYYQVPGGGIGEFLLSPIIKPKVEGIFTHRKKVLQHLFPGLT